MGRADQDVLGFQVPVAEKKPMYAGDVPRQRIQYRFEPGAARVLDEAIQMP